MINVPPPLPYTSDSDPNAGTERPAGRANMHFAIACVGGSFEAQHLTWVAACLSE